MNSRHVLSAILVVLFCYAFSGVISAGMTHDIRSLKQCGEFIEVESKQTKRNTLQFVVRIDTIKAAIVPDEYSERFSVLGELAIVADDSIVGSMLLHKGTTRGRSEFSCELSPELAKQSSMTIRVTLFERDGIATIGGGHIFNIALGGFLPT